jgi:hypothetical protein
MKASTKSLLMVASALWIVGSSAAWGYGGTIGPAEYVGMPKQATNYKNPLPVAGQPHRYHVTICNDGNWYGAWYPAEWNGNDDRVQATPSGNNQHGYAKEEDGTGGGVQIMGNGRGGDSIEVTLHKKHGQTVYLRIRVIDCSHLQAPRGLLAGLNGYSPAPAQESLFPASGFGTLVPSATERMRERLDAVPGGYRASPQLTERPAALSITPKLSGSYSAPTNQTQLKEVR